MAKLEVSTFGGHYLELLEEVAARRSELGVRAVAAHWPHVGSAHRGLLVVGQALRGWSADWPPDALATAAGRSAILAEAAAVNAQLDEPLSWVPVHPKVKNSSFWLFMQRLADVANPGPEPWFARIAWWNLYPLAPTDPVGNPWGPLKDSQERMAGALLEDVVTSLNADRVALVPGRMRLRRAEPLGLEELTNAWPLFAAGAVDGRRWTVGEHPGWASRRRFGPSVYASLVASWLATTGRSA